AKMFAFPAVVKFTPSTVTGPAPKKVKELIGARLSKLNVVAPVVAASNAGRLLYRTMSARVGVASAAQTARAASPDNRVDLWDKAITSSFKIAVQRRSAVGGLVADRSLQGG